MAESKSVNRGLSHITVLEEAHNLLRRCDSLSNPVLAKSVEMISNSIAEMRTYGEGFVIVDQSPGAVDISAVRNTNTKIVMRLPDYEDALTVGHAASLDDDQIAEVSRLGTGEAIITQNNWLEAVLAQIDPYDSGQFSGEDSVTTPSELVSARGKILEQYMKDRVEKTYQPDAMLSCISGLGLNRHKTKEQLDFWKRVYGKGHLPRKAFEDVLCSFLGCRDFFLFCPPPSFTTLSEREKEVTAWKKKARAIIGRYAAFSSTYSKDKIILNLLSREKRLKKADAYTVLIQALRK